MSKKSRMYNSTSGPGPTVIPTVGMESEVSIPTKNPTSPTGPTGTGGPTIPTETTQPVDYTGNIGQYGSYGPSTSNMFGGPGSSATKIIYRDVMVNQGGTPNQVANVQSGTEAAQMQNLVGSNSDQARQEALRQMGGNMSINSTFDPRRPQTGGLFGIAFSKTTDSKTTF